MNQNTTNYKFLFYMIVEEKCPWKCTYNFLDIQAYILLIAGLPQKWDVLHMNKGWKNFKINTDPTGACASLKHNFMSSVWLEDDLTMLQNRLKCENVVLWATFMYKYYD